jgi:hypothetical protein
MVSKTATWRRGALALAVVSMMGSPAAAQQVGKAAAVNQDATKGGQVLEIGAVVIHKERIVTNARGTTQLLFIDQTTLNIGPNSDLLIDEYVFDPNKGVGKMTVSLAKGAMRFIGGQITHNSSASVNTPPATIGIRGGVADIVTDGQKTSTSNSYGTITVTPTAGGPTVTVPQGSTGSTSGSGTTVAPTTQQQASTTNVVYQSKGTQTGGASPATSQAAADASAKNTTTTSSIGTTSSPAPGSTAPGPSTTTASSTGGGTPSGGPSSTGPAGSAPGPQTWFPNTPGPSATSPPLPPGSPGGNTKSSGGGGGGKGL